MSAERKDIDPYRQQHGWKLIPVIVVLNGFANEPGVYTDGILQLTALENRIGLYPPLYGVLARGYNLLSYRLVPLETAASFVTVLALLLTILTGIRPLGAKLIGYRTSWLAVLLFILSPLAFRWSILAMSDMTFVAFSTGGMYCLMEAWAQLRMDSRGRSHKMLAWAVVLGALATLTRYQGILLAPLIALVTLLYMKRFRAVPWLAFAAGLLWLLVPAWMWYNGFVHQDQFAARTTAGFWSNFAAWLNTAESFVLISPYYFGYPIAAAAIAGIFYVRRVAQPWYARPAAVLWGLYGILILALQARFGSLQYRYMLPLLPMVVVLAAVGFKWLEDRFPHRPKLRRWALILTVIYLAFFNLCILALQRRPFMDQYRAAEFIKEQVPVTTPVYSNERYGSFTDLGSVKLSFWSGRPVKILLSPDQPMEPGAVLVLGNAYGGNAAVGMLLEELSQRYELTPLIEEPYRSRVIPLMDDVMVEPMFNQNPMGWVMRYTPQEFATQIFRVMPRGAGATEAGIGR